MVRIENVISQFSSYSKGIDSGPIQKAYILAARNQPQFSFFRQTYLPMALEVAMVLTELKLDVQSIVSGLLHGLVVEGAVDLKEVQGLMGDETAAILDGLQKILALSKKDTDEKEQLAEHMRQVIFATSKDLRIIFVILAVRLVRMRHWNSFSKTKTRALALETFEIYAPLAERFGLSHIKLELEDLSFELLYPKEFRQIAEFKKLQEETHRELLTNLQTQVREQLKESDIAGEVKGRIKHNYSIYRKAKLNQVEYEDIHDIIGIRVIVETKDDAYKVLGLIHNHYTPVAERFKDYISNPKPNGYQSLHTMAYDQKGLGFEVQIRTADMHEVAEKGIAAHWAYKAANRQESQEHENPFWLQELTNSLNLTSDPSESLEIFKRELYSDFVYVFSPKGKIVKLPVGATVIDFAYSIHSDIGDHCSGASINGVQRAIRTRLANGDKIFVQTSDKQHPSSAWLEHAVTTRALSRIRGYIKKRERQGAEKVGREVYENQLRQLGLKPKHFEETAEFREFLSQANFKNLTHFCEQIGFGNADALQLKHFLVGRHQDLLPAPPEQAEPPRPRSLPSLTRKTEDSPGGVKIAGLDEVMIHYAKCCNPVKGDEIIGIISQGRGVTIHLKHCPNALPENFEPGRLLDAQWTKTFAEKLPVRIKLTFNQDIKTSLQIYKVLAASKVMLIESNLKLIKEQSYQDLLLKVDDHEQLSRTLKKLNAIKSVAAIRVRDQVELEQKGA